jgi:hypothetical protein
MRVDNGITGWDCHRHGLTDPNTMTGANGAWAGADGLGQVLTGTTLSALGWSATQVWVDYLVLTTLRVSSVLMG